jgi:hypothetical protein
VFKHESAAINAFAVGAVSPIAVYSLELAATPALFRVEVVPIVVCIDRPPTAITPDNKKVTCLRIYFAAHSAMSPVCSLLLLVGAATYHSHTMASWHLLAP